MMKQQKIFFCWVCKKEMPHNFDALLENIGWIRYVCAKCGRNFVHIDAPKKKVVKQKAEQSLADFLK